MDFATTPKYRFSRVTRNTTIVWLYLLLMNYINEQEYRPSLAFMMDFHFTLIICQQSYFLNELYYIILIGLIFFRNLF